MLIDQDRLLATTELAAVAGAGAGASDVVGERGARGQLRVARTGLGVCETGVVVVFRYAVADARLDAHASGVGVRGGRERVRGGIGVAAEARIGADLLDKGGDYGGRGRVPHAEIRVCLRVFAATDFGRVAGTRGVAGIVAEGGIRLQSVAARTCVTVFDRRETVVVVSAVFLATLECHLPRGRFHHSGESRRRGLIRAAQIDPIFDDLARGWSQLC